MSLFGLGLDAASRRKGTEGQAGERATEGDDKRNPLAVLGMFVPAETIAIYVTVANTLLTAFGANSRAAAVGWYAFCLSLTPVFTWIGFATQWRRDHEGTYPSFSDAPWFRIGSSAVAFAAWGLAVSPKVGAYIVCGQDVCASAESLAGIAAIIVGVILTVLDGLVNYTPKNP